MLFALDVGVVAAEPRGFVVEHDVGGLVVGRGQTRHTAARGHDVRVTGHPGGCCSRMVLSQRP